jgi:hypothetical protein
MLSNKPKKNDVLDFLNIKDETDALSRNVGNKLPTNASQQLRRAKISYWYLTDNLILIPYWQPYIDTLLATLY